MINKRYIFCKKELWRYQEARYSDNFFLYIHNYIAVDILYEHIVMLWNIMALINTQE